MSVNHYDIVQAGKAKMKCNFLLLRQANYLPYFYVLPWGRYYTCTVRRTKNRILMQRSSRWKYIRKMAWDRDRKARAVCHICGQPIDYSLPPSSGPEAWEPDHVIPVSKRPDLELDLNNILASHTRCNRSRGDGTNGENALGMRSRIW